MEAIAGCATGVNSLFYLPDGGLPWEERMSRGDRFVAAVYGGP